MSPAPEGPNDPLEAQKKTLLDRVFRLRQHPKIHGNQEAQDALTEVTGHIKTAKDTTNILVIEAALTHIEDNILNA